jgi:hypothetical protein
MMLLPICEAPSYCMKLLPFYEVTTFSMTQQNFFLYQYGIKKNAKFYADFKFVDAGFQKWSKKLKAKKPEKMQNSHRFLAIAV